MDRIPLVSATRQRALLDPGAARFVFHGRGRAFFRRWSRDSKAISQFRRPNTAHLLRPRATFYSSYVLYEIPTVGSRWAVDIGRTDGLVTLDGRRRRLGCACHNYIIYCYMIDELINYYLQYIYIYIYIYILILTL